jgi:hypothetical protein
MKFIIILALSAICARNPNANNLGALIYNDVTMCIEKELASAVLHSLEKDLGIHISVYWETENIGGCEKEKTVSLTLRNQPAIIALERIAKQMGTEENEATWQLRDGVVEIGLKSRLAKKSSQRLVTYPIMDLLFVVGDFSFLGEDANQNPRPTAADNQKRIDALIEKITLLIESDMWEQNSGTCTITNHHETLLIRAPDFVHRQIGGYTFKPTKPSDIKERRVSYSNGRTSVRKN